MNATRKIVSIGSLIATMLALGAFTAFGAGTRGSEAGSPQTGTYKLSQLEITYPYVDPGTMAADKNAAEVSFAAEWSNEFPGKVDCHLSLLDAAGSSVGEHDFFVASVTRVAESQTTVAAVTGTPASVTGSCDEGSYWPGEGYTFVLSRVDSADTGDAPASTISFDTSWASAVDPVVRTCTLDATLSDGSHYGYDFNYWAPVESTGNLKVPYASDQVDRATVNCHEIQGEG